MSLLLTDLSLTYFTHSYMLAVQRTLFPQMDTRIFFLSPLLPLILLNLSTLFSTSYSLAFFNPDMHPLLEFKSSSDPLNSLSSWSSATDPCAASWLGVTCRNNRVTRLVLLNLGLAGPLQVLSRLDQLRLLSLQHNNLSASSVDLSGFKNVKLLYLSFNSFSGGFPLGISALRRLRRLDLSHNRFSGRISGTELDGLLHLVTLRLEDNFLSGTLPDNLPKTISDFNVSGNELAGAIPESLSAFPVSAFYGNQHLCGRPLDNNCFAKPFRSDPIPVSLAPQPGRTRLRRNLVLLIVVADAFVLLAVVGILFFCCRRQAGRVVGKAAKKVAGGERSRTETDSFGEEMELFEGCDGFRRVEDLLHASAEILGKGSVGTTYKALVEGGKAVVVVKRVREKRNWKEVGTTLREIGRLRHGHVVALRAYYCSKDEMLLVYDYLPNGSLHSLLHGNRGPGRTPLEWTTRLKLATGAAEGLRFLHAACEPKTAHGHLTSSNILVDHDGNACVSDFGLHQLIATTLPSSTSPNKAYRAPEFVTARELSQKCDVYSFGVVLLETLTGRSACEVGWDLVKWVKQTGQEEWTREVFDLELMGCKERREEEMVALLQVALLCLAQQPRDRPKMSVVHQMIEDIEVRGSGRKGRGGGGVHSSPLHCLSSDSSPDLSK